MVYRWMDIERVSNSYGVGYRIWTRHGAMTYYGYSKRDAERKYRQTYNLVGVKFTKLEY